MDSDERKWEIKASFREDELAPVVLFTYNRLEHTKKTVEALQQNVLAADTKLFIYSDAPKNEGAKDSVAAVREYLRSVTGFKKIEIIEREENWGLARNIIDGVTKIVNEYGKIIVLEDDIVTSPYFLQYMNDALERYKDENQVMEINAYAPEMEKDGINETYFLCFGDCWGWATWDRAWKYFKREPEKIRDSFSVEEIRRFNLDGNTSSFFEQITANCNGKLYTWAIFWYAAIFKQNGLSLMVRDSMVRNCGFDGSGEHCGFDSAYDTKIITEPVTYFPLEIKEDINARNKIGEFFRKQEPSLLRKYLGGILRFIKRKV